ncbi:MAG: cobalt ECF transporter T component CbiQ [Bacillota bacterium]
MLSIDQYAYTNRLSSAHPGEKFAFATVTMTVCLASDSIATCLAATLLMVSAVIVRAGIPCKFYFKLMTLPLSFLLIGVATVAVSISFSAPDGEYLWGMETGRLWAGVYSGDAEKAALIFFKSQGAVSSLYFLSLTTPVTEINWILRKLKAPAILVELMNLIYRFIFVLAETADKIYTSQSSRLGYKNIRSGYHSFGQLVSNIFLKSYHRSGMLLDTMTARCYTGEIRVLEPRYKVSHRNVACIILVEIFLTALTLSLKLNLIKL